MASKKPESVFKSFTHALGDSDLTYFCSRMYYRYQDDLAEAWNYLDTLRNDLGELNPASYLFASAKNYDEFNKLNDMFENSLMREYDKRGFHVQQLI